jgi:hypothetical protein
MAVQTATKTVVASFENLSRAEQAVRELQGAGYSKSDISVLTNRVEPGASQFTDDSQGRTGENVAADAGIGAALGGIGGLLVGFAGLAVPGVGPILAAGPIIAALTGAGVGAVAGGMIGALTASGIPEEEAHYYAEGVRRGQTVVTVKTEEDRADRAREILDRFGAIDVEDRAASWRDQGWTGHNPGAEPLSADEIRRERENYSAKDDEWTREEWLSGKGGDPDAGVAWPHNEAYDIGSDLPRAEARNAAVDKQRTLNQAPSPMREASRDTSAAIGSTVKPMNRDPDNPSNYSDAIENNRRRPDPATVSAERGFERAKESAVRSAQRMRSRIYDTRS